MLFWTRIFLWNQKESSLRNVQMQTHKNHSLSIKRAQRRAQISSADAWLENLFRLSIEWECAPFAICIFIKRNIQVIIRWKCCAKTVRIDWKMHTLKKLSQVIRYEVIKKSFIYAFVRIELQAKQYERSASSFDWKEKQQITQHFNWAFCKWTHRLKNAHPHLFIARVS